MNFFKLERIKEEFKTLDNRNTKKRVQLEKEGWKKRFTIENHRIQEYKELYESLNLEVRIEPVIPSEIEGCSNCYEAECDKYKVIYTRVKGKSKSYQ